MCNLNPDPQSQARQPFDWRIFENCSNLKSFEIGCPPMIGEIEIEPMASINFQKFPSQNIEEFYVYKVIMSPDDVRKVSLSIKIISQFEFFIFI